MFYAGVTGELDKYQQACEQMLGDYGQSSEAYYCVAIGFMGVGEYEKALESSRHAMDLAPDDASVVRRK